MTLKEYLISLFGDKKANEIFMSAKTGKTIVISGVNASGKTSLVKVLRKKGYNAVEDFETYNVVLDKKLDGIIPNIDSEIS